MTATFLTSPLDVVKTRLQSDFYKQQLAAQRAASGTNLRYGVLGEGARHLKETFHILLCVSLFNLPAVSRDEISD